MRGSAGRIVLGAAFAALVVGLPTTAAAQDEAHVALHAEAIQGIATMAADAFPEGTGGEGSRVKDEVWANWDDFMERYGVLKSAADALGDAAHEGDMDGVQAAMADVRSSCRSCHDDYRAPAN